MKKILMVFSLIVVVLLAATFAYADGSGESKFTSPWNRSNSSSKEMEEWHNERMSHRREDLERAVEEGSISQEEAKSWNEHYDNMEEFHKENGFMNKGWGCHGRGKSNGMMRHHRRGN